VSVAIPLFPQAARLPVQGIAFASLTSRRPNLVWRFVISAVAAAAKLWPQNENLIFQNDFNSRGSQYDSDRGKPLSERKRARRVTFIISEMATPTEEAR
jgi:hypothetical protein